MNKTLLSGCLATLCLVPIHKSFAEQLSPIMLYKFAKQGNEQALSQYRDNIDLVDSNGYTALCYAALYNDSKSYVFLKSYGADNRVPCLTKALQARNTQMTQRGYSVQKTSAEQSDGTFLGMGKVGWSIVGVAAVGGGVALAASGGGGGSSSSHSDIRTNQGGTVDSDGDYVGILNQKSNNGTISITNIENRDVYGMKNTELTYTTNALKENDNDTVQSIVNIENYGNNNVYGVASIASTLEYFDVSNAFGAAEGSYNMAAEGFIRIDNYGSGNAYGVFAPTDTENYVYNVIPLFERYPSYEGENSYNRAIGVITLINHGSGTAYGLFGAETDQFSYQEENDLISATTNIINLSNGTAVGLQASDYAVNEGDVNIYNLGNGMAYGLRGYDQTSIHNYGNIIITRDAYTDDKLTKTTSDDVTYSALSASGGRAYGMYGEAGSYIENDGVIHISGAEDAIGIYGANGSKDNPTQIVNSGTIDISASDTAYGIVAGGSNVTITNTGTIKINGTENIAVLDSANIKSAAIVLNGATLVNDSTISATSLDLDAFGGNVVATSHATFTADQNITGTLKMASDIVSEGFSDTYTTTGTINAEDISNLSLVSQSALFSATLAENNSDVTLTMNAFNDVVDNDSLADFLQNNYAAENNESLYSLLKKQETVASLNDTLNQITGQKLFTRFADEDLTMMRELTFDINNQLFMNNDEHMEKAGSVSTFNFNANTGSDSRYALISQNYGSYNLGLNYGFTNVRSDDGDHRNQRTEKMFHMGMPVSYAKRGIKFISTPHVGYASGTYDRKGLSGESYDGSVKKTMFGLMNEARYPVSFGQWVVAPSVEFNMVDYRTQASEKGGDYKLNLDAQHNFSVEAGFGLYANTAYNFGGKSKLSLTSGVALYHEFADPYKFKIGMDGMNGAFTLRDSNRSDNRAVVRTGLNYTYDNISLSGNLMSYIDREYRTNATLNFKYNF